MPKKRNGSLIVVKKVLTAVVMAKESLSVDSGT
jgi:hypothetical protein